ncbi:MAG TPA: UMP kinase [Candidatus Paceibacterota bacterium]
MENKEYIIISLGGSLIIPDQIDVNFLKDFKQLIIAQIEKGKKFVIVTGGGKLCRTYQNVAKEISNPTSEDLDWIGIAALKLNAELLRVVFGEYANSMVVSNLSDNLSFERPIIIGSAYKPGQSTDWGAVIAAENIGSKIVINLSNTDYVYDSDPNKNPNAKKIEKMSWEDYRNLIPKDWNPGLNSPFDPIASKKAEELGIEVHFISGGNLESVKNCIDNLPFIGTTIK